MTELGEAGVNDQEMVALTGRSRQTLSVYTRRTDRQLSDPRPVVRG